MAENEVDVAELSPFGEVAFTIANQILQDGGAPSLALVIDALHIEVESFDRDQETLSDYYRRRLIEFFDQLAGSIATLPRDEGGLISEGSIGLLGRAGAGDSTGEDDGGSRDAVDADQRQASDVPTEGERD